VIGYIIIVFNPNCLFQRFLHSRSYSGMQVFKIRSSPRNFIKFNSDNISQFGNAWTRGLGFNCLDAHSSNISQRNINSSSTSCIQNPGSPCARPTMTTLFGSSSASATNTQGDLSKDVELKQPPTDSVSEIAFSPKSDLLAVSSWDQKVRIYAIDSYGQGEGKAAFDFQAPALGVAWSTVRSSECQSTCLLDPGRHESRRSRSGQDGADAGPQREQ
jgi:WD40 repeat protein